MTTTAKNPQGKFKYISARLKDYRFLIIREFSHMKVWVVSNGKSFTCRKKIVKKQKYFTVNFN